MMNIIFHLLQTNQIFLYIYIIEFIMGASAFNLLYKLPFTSKKVFNVILRMLYSVLVQVVLLVL